MPASSIYPSPNPVKHTPLEDVQGLSIGIFICGIGITILAQLGFVTGQTAGIALIFAHLSGWSFGLCFFVINLPFYWFGYKRLGLEFTIKSVICVTCLSLLTDYLPLGFAVDQVNPVLGTAIFGVLTGLGLLAVFRHRGSLGGMGVIALIIQDKTGFKAGYVQLIVDCVIFAVAAFLFPLTVVLYSLFGALILNMVITFNHRRDRYLGDRG